MRTNNFDVNNDQAEIHVEAEGDHLHETDTDQINCDRFKENLRTEIEGNPTVPVKRVYNQLSLVEHRQADNVDHLVLPSFQSVKSTMDRKRSQHYPRCCN